MLIPLSLTATLILLSLRLFALALAALIWLLRHVPLPVYAAIAAAIVAGQLGA